MISKLTKGNWLTLAVFAIPLILSIAAFSNVIKGDFLWDDISHQKSQIDRYKSPADIFTKSFFAGGNLIHQQSPYYRPAIATTYKIGEALNNLVFDESVERMGARRAIIPHILTLITHLITVLLVMVLTWQLIGNHAWRPLAVLASGLIFSTHPIHVESISFIAGRTDTISTLFLVAALITTWRYRERGRVHLLILTAVFYLFSLFSKETGLAVLFIAPAMLWLFSGSFAKTNEADEEEDEEPEIDLSKIGRNQPCPCGSGKKYKTCHGKHGAPKLVLSRHKKVRTKDWQPLWFIGTLVLVTIVYFVVRSFADLVSLDFLGKTGPVDALARMIAGAAFYFGKLLYPLPLVHMHWDIPGFAYSAVMLGAGVALTAAAIFAFRKGHAIFLFSVVLFVFTLGPSLLSVLNEASTTPVSERLLYTPSIALSLSLAGLIVILQGYARHAVLGLAVIISLLSVWVIRERNWDWQSQDTLWAALIRFEENRLPKRTKVIEQAVSWRAMGASYLARAEYYDDTKTDFLDKAEHAYGKVVELTAPGEQLNIRGLISTADTHYRRAARFIKDEDTANAAEYYGRAAKAYKAALKFSRGTREVEKFYVEATVLEDQEREKITKKVDLNKLFEAREQLLVLRRVGYLPLWVTEYMSVVDHRIGVGYHREGKPEESKKYLESSDQEDVHLERLKRGLQ